MHIHFLFLHGSIATLAYVNLSIMTIFIGMTFVKKLFIKLWRIKLYHICPVFRFLGNISNIIETFSIFLSVFFFNQFKCWCVKKWWVNHTFFLALHSIFPFFLLYLLLCLMGIWNMMLVNVCTSLKSIPWKQTQKSFNKWYSV